MKNLEVNKKLLQKVMKTGTAFVLAGTLLMGSNMVLPTIKNNSAVVSAEEANLVNLNVQMGVNLYMNDKGFIPRDVNGNETYPFIYEGTTYVPIRAIAELFNASVNWDASSNTVSIVTSGEEVKLNHTNRPIQAMYNMNIPASKGTKLVVNGQEIIPTDVNGNSKDIYVVKGTTYVPVRAISTALGLPIAWSDLTNSVFIGRHKTEGLTVENINDPEFFYECGRNFLDLNGALDTGIHVFGESYWLGSFKDTKHYPITFILLAANYDYCPETLIEDFFSGMDDFTFDFDMECFYIPIVAINNGCRFKWENYVVDETTGQYLNLFQEECIKAYQSTGDFSKVLDVLYDYFNSSNEVRYQNANIFLDYIMSHTVTFLDKYGYIDPYSTKLGDLSYYKNYYSDAKKRLRQQLETRRKYVNDNKIKQIQYKK